MVPAGGPHLTRSWYLAGAEGDEGRRTQSGSPIVRNARRVCGCTPTFRGVGLSLVTVAATIGVAGVATTAVAKCCVPIFCEKVKRMADLCGLESEWTI